MSFSRKQADKKRLPTPTLAQQRAPSPSFQSLSSTLPGSSAFDRAVHVVNISNAHATLNPAGFNDNQASNDRVSFSPEEQLLLYGAYKQAMKGNVKGIKPTFFDIAARSKWQAWSNMRGKTQEEAKEHYVDLVVKSLRKESNHPDLHLLANEITLRPYDPSPSTPSSSPQIFATDKDLPPISIHAASPPVTSPPSPTDSFATARSSNTTTTTTVTTSSSPYNFHPTRKSSISHSIRSTATGMRSAATSVYELASEGILDSDSEDQPQQQRLETTEERVVQDDPLEEYITETLVEEEILSDDDIVDEHGIVHKARRAPQEQVSEDEDDGDEVYQSSEEYDDDDSESDNTTDHGSVHSPGEAQEHDKLAKEGMMHEGIFEEGGMDEQDNKDTPASPPAINRTRSGSISSGYGGSVFSDKEGGPGMDLMSLVHGTHQDKMAGLASPPVEPYRVQAVYDTTSPAISPLELAPPLESPVSEPLPASTLETESTPPATESPAKDTQHNEASMEGLVCPVSKKTAASGGVCPAAMFAQARAAAAAFEGASSSSTAAPQAVNTSPRVHSSHSSPGPILDSSSPSVVAAPLATDLVSHQRSATEPVRPSSPRPASTLSTTSSASKAGKRLGQGIVNRFSALRSSLAAASARAASSALSGGASSAAASKNKNQMVVKDLHTNQPVTVICPHLATTQVLETEVVRLQTDISVLHERLDLLQESLKMKSQSRALERRSARGILKLVLRQGLINAVLLLLVFAVLYKRKSPIAFAIMAYVGQGAKEGEAGWRRLMRWSADLVRRGQRNQAVLLSAGRRNGYW